MDHRGREVPYTRLYTWLKCTVRWEHLLPRPRAFRVGPEACALVFVDPPALKSGVAQLRFGYKPVVLADLAYVFLCIQKRI